MFNEALYMEDMEHTLINTNQCRHFGSKLQEIPYDQKKLITIISPDKEFVAFLQSEGTVVFLDTWYPTQGELEVYPHIEMRYSHHWNPHEIQFTRTKQGVQYEKEGRIVAAALMCFYGGVSR